MPAIWLYAASGVARVPCALGQEIFLVPSVNKDYRVWSEK